MLCYVTNISLEIYFSSTDSNSLAPRREYPSFLQVSIPPEHHYAHFPGISCSLVDEGHNSKFSDVKHPSCLTYLSAISTCYYKFIPCTFHFTLSCQKINNHRTLQECIQKKTNLLATVTLITTNILNSSEC